ncbi:olfactory receptor 1J4-like [Engystomops pustulosus]|uniref:olfactory receptor 1J4-like n=1 Tax=Engystomops pustulosus TaxID=76066 RepID=UPI003AFA8E6A
MQDFRLHRYLYALAALGIKVENLMVWPTSSLDLNPIENLWRIIKQKIYEGFCSLLPPASLKNPLHPELSHRYSNLKTPMYFFLTHLSWSDILLTLVTMPTMLSVLLKNGQTITFLGCITQLYLFGSTTITECFLLTAMSYDRYLAICFPLRYHTIMDFKHRVFLVTSSWVSAFLLTFIIVCQIGQLNFCANNIIDHFICDPTPLMALSCSDTSMIEFQDFVMGAPMTLCPLTFIIVTYVYIFTTIMKISTTVERQKAFSTCSSHLAVVCMYYGTLITLYVVPLKGLSSNLTKVQSLLYTVVTPLSNPIIYSLRNNEIRTELKKLL